MICAQATEIGTHEIKAIHIMSTCKLKVSFFSNRYFLLTEEKELMSTLLDKYNDVLDMIPLNPLLENIGLPVEQLYVEVEMINDRKSLQRTPKDVNKTSNTKIHAYKDLLYTNAKPHKRVFIRGKAGYGKTCFSLRMIQEWLTAQRKGLQDLTANQQVMSGYQFVFYIAFRYLKSQEKMKGLSVEDIVCGDYFMSNDSRKLKSNVKHVLKSSQYRCLVVLDGLDESHSRVLPSCDGLGNCQVIFTSRPSKLTNLSLKYQHDDIIVEIVGLDRELKSLKRLIKTVLVNFHGETEDSKSFIKAYDSVVGQIQDMRLEKPMDIPMLASYLVIRLCDGKAMKASLTDNYIDIIQMLIERAHRQGRLSDDTKCFFKRIAPDYFQSYSDIPEVLVPFIFPLLLLGKLAMTFLLTRNAMLVFSERELLQNLHPSGFEIKDFGIKTGIICQSTVPGNATGDLSVNFLHKSVQEFLAALFLSYDESVFQYFVCTHLDCLDTYMELSEIFIFLSGLKPEYGTMLSLRVLELTYDDEQFQEYRSKPWYTTNMTRVSELQTIQLRCFKEIINSSREIEINRHRNFKLADAVLSTFSEETAMHFIRHKTSWSEMVSICIDDNSLEETIVNKIILESRSLRTLVIRKFSLSLPWISELLSTNEYSELDLPNPFYNDEASLFNQITNVSLAEMHDIPWPSTLTVLSIEDVLLSPLSIHAMCMMFKQNETLEILRLISVRVKPCNDGTPFCDVKGIMISGRANLKELYLEKTPVSNVNLDLCSKLTNITHKSLFNANDLSKRYNTRIDFTRHMQLQEVIMSNVPMKTSEPSENMYGIDFLLNSKLKTLVLVNTGMTKIGISHNTQLQEVVLGNKNTILFRETPDLHAPIREINVSRCTNLKKLTIWNAQISKVDLSQNIQLEELTLVDTNLQMIDLSNNPLLRNLELIDTQICNIDLSNNKRLKRLVLEDIPLKKIALSQNTQLTKLSLVGTCVKQLDLSKNTSLLEVSLRIRPYMRKHRITGAECISPFIGEMLMATQFIDEGFFDEYMFRTFPFHSTIRFDKELLSKNFHLQILCLQDVNLEEVDLSQNTLLTQLFLRRVPVNRIRLSQCLKLNIIEISDCTLEVLDLSGNTNLKQLTLKRTPIEYIDLSENVELAELEVEKTNIKVLNLRQNKHLYAINVTDTAVHHIDISLNKTLSMLTMRHANITSITWCQSMAQYGNIDLDGVNMNQQSWNALSWSLLLSKKSFYISVRNINDQGIVFASLNAAGTLRKHGVNFEFIPRDSEDS